jgi:hypothetical protein
VSADVDAYGVSLIVGIGLYGGGLGLVVYGLSRRELGAGGGVHVGCGGA